MREEARTAGNLDLAICRELGKTITRQATPVARDGRWLVQGLCSRCSFHGFRHGSGTPMPVPIYMCVCVARAGARCTQH